MPHADKHHVFYAIEMGVECPVDRVVIQAVIDVDLALFFPSLLHRRGFEQAKLLRSLGHD